MREASLISELRTALRRRGVWGSRAEWLVQEWTEHVRTDAAQRVEKGADPEAAEEAAWQALGSADVLASSAARELAEASWLGRHPWLGGMVLPAFGWFALAVAILSAPPWIASRFSDIDTMERTHLAALLTGVRCWQYAFNWLPWLLSLAWLARIAGRMPGGWKLFCITAVVLTLCSTSLEMEIHPPLHGPGSGTLMIYGSGILGVIANTFGHLLGYRAYFWPWSNWSRETTTSWIQTAIMMLGATTFYLKMSAAHRIASATVGS